MRTPLVVGVIVSCLLAVGTVRAAQQSRETPFEATRTKMIALHASLISAAAPPVRGKIAASSAAARQYLATCGRHCDLQSFLARDLTSRFTRLKRKQLNLLTGLVFAETTSSDNELSLVRLEELEQKRNLLITLLTNLLNTSDQTLMSTLKNIKP